LSAAVTLGAKPRFAEQLERGALVSLTLDQHVENLALVIDRAPSAFRQCGRPSRRGASDCSAENEAGEVVAQSRPEFQHPTTHALV
jgi:hypothetical protein